MKSDDEVKCGKKYDKKLDPWMVFGVIIFLYFLTWCIAFVALSLKLSNN